MKTSSIDEVRKMYDETADSYAQMMDQEIDLPIYAELLGQIQEDIADVPGALLDTACGSGHMLAMYRSRFDPQRPLIGVDLSPRMVAIATERLGSDGQILLGDMRSLPDIASDSAAAVLNFFAVHHLDEAGLRASMAEWHRVLVSNGRLLVAAWEGSGPIDYGDHSDIIAQRYTCKVLSELAEQAGFTVIHCTVKAVEDFPMDAVYLEVQKA
jgi:ubiquinone/menaquinone biosynthesis C-methylase UbiE